MTIAASADTGDRAEDVLRQTTFSNGLESSDRNRGSATKVVPRISRKQMLIFGDATPESALIKISNKHISRTIPGDAPQS